MEKLRRSNIEHRGIRRGATEPRQGWNICSPPITRIPVLFSGSAGLDVLYRKTRWTAPPKNKKEGRLRFSTNMPPPNGVSIWPAAIGFQALTKNKCHIFSAGGI